jgi:transcriptional regulator with XRE-family HTH domain
MSEPAVEPAVGRRLRELRTLRGESLDAVASRAGLSRAFLSQVERGVSSPSVTSITKLAESLGVSLSALFAPAAEDDEGFVSATGRERDIYGEGHADELLTPSVTGRMLALLCRIEASPDGSWGETYVHEAGEECVVVLDGHLEVAVEGDEVMRLGKGDALTFPSDRPHQWRNPGSSITSAVWVLVRSDGGEPPARDDRAP